MKTAHINHYLETVSNPNGRFKSLSDIQILRDERGLPRYAVRSRTLDIAVSCQGKIRVICCPLHAEGALDLRGYVSNRYDRQHPQLLLNEMLIFNDREESLWQDILLADATPETFAITDTNPGATPTPSPAFADHLLFGEGLAPTPCDGLYGYIDRQGQTVIPFRYDWADAFDEGLAVVRKNGRFGLVDKQGNEICKPEYEDIRWRSDNGVIFVCTEGIWSLKDRQGHTIHENTFDFILDYSEGLASVRREGKYGYIDHSGEIVIPTIYDEAYSFSPEGLATVVKNGIAFCIDTEGMVFD